MKDDLKITVRYVCAVFRPGMKGPEHPEPARTLAAPAETWQEHDQTIFLEEVRRAIDTQQADKREIRTRAQVLLSIALLIGAAAVAGSTATVRSQWWVLILYFISLALVVIAALACAGILTARSDIGSVNLDNVVSAETKAVGRAVVLEYAASAMVGARTVAVMVTALRMSMAILIIGFLVMSFAFAGGQLAHGDCETTANLHCTQPASRQGATERP